MNKVTQRILLALTCCLVLVLVPVVAGAQDGVLGTMQHGVQKGAQGVEKGGKAVVDKTKEGAQATKDAITGEDTNTDRQKPSTEATKSESTTSKSTTSESTTSKGTMPSKSGGQRLPATGGELPMLAFLGISALTGAAASWRAGRRNKRG